MQTPKPSEFEKKYKRIDDEYLGNGAQGQVFKVVKRDDADGKVYAAKTYFTKHSQEYITKLFEREVRMYQMLPESPLISQLVDHFDDTDIKVLVLELIEGKSFQSLIGHNHQVSEKVKNTTCEKLFTKEQVVKWTIQMANIIKILQKSRLIYADFHFGNIMLRTNDDLVLTDFGYCFEVDDQLELIGDNDDAPRCLENYKIEFNFHKKLGIKKMYNHFHIKKLGEILKQLLKLVGMNRNNMFDFQDIRDLRDKMLKDPVKKRVWNGSLKLESINISEVLNTLQQMSLKNGFNFDDSLFETKNEDIKRGMKLTEAEQKVEQMFGHIF